MTRYKVVGELDYVQGYLRYGHLELEIDKETWDGLTEDEQYDMLSEYGDLVVDDYTVEDRGSIYKISKEECKNENI